MVATGSEEVMRTGQGEQAVQARDVARPREASGPCLQLRTLRSRIVGMRAVVEFYLACLLKAPRFEKTLWRVGCCDGAAPVGVCPKHILAAVSVGGEWPAGASERGAELAAAPEAWRHSIAARASGRLSRPLRD